MPQFIAEGAIFQEAEVVKASPGKAIFRMTMQTSDEVNQNRRLYPHQVLDEGMKACKPRIQRKAFFGELDHPCPTGKNTFDEIRQTTVMLKEVSHMIRDYEWRGNRLIGELETASTPNGKILAGLLHDRSGVGLSMRGLASLEKYQDYNQVKGPLTVVAFDSVSLPSHKSAVVDFNEMRFESKKFLSENIREGSDGTICTPDGQCYLANYFDRLVETKVVEFFNRWV